MRHMLIVVAITVVITLGMGFLLQSANLLPPAASQEGELIDSMFSLQLWIISFLFSLIVVLMLYSVTVFRRKPGDEEADGEYVTGNTGLEITWTVIPLVVVIAISTLGASYLSQIIQPAQDELRIQVTGFQFGWRFDYPDTGVSSNTLYLPRERKIYLELTSLDVIHSFWVPEFRVKQDAVPGRTTSLRFTPTEAGGYVLRCAELCGLAHSGMVADVVVVEPAEFQAWLDGEAAAVAAAESSPVDLGARVYLLNCVSCHSVDGGPGVGPTFLGQFGLARALESGESVVMDETYLRNSIVNPASQVVAGYASIMPQGYGDTLPAEEIDALVAYIKSLGRQ